MGRTSAFSRRRALPCFAAFFLTTLLAVSAPAQTKVRATDGMTPVVLSQGSPAGSYPLSGFESVNLYNGGLSFALPLAGVGGRGGAASSFVLPFRQTWSVTRQHDPSTEVFSYLPTLDWWESSAGVPHLASLKVRRAVSGSINCTGVGAAVAKQTLTRVTFTAPDGTEYEMVDRQTGGQPHNQVCTSSGFSRGTEFVTTDGSSATFIADAPVADSWMAGDNISSPVAGVVILRDGTRYIFGATDLNAVRDRNGNLVTFSASGQTATDPLNRQVTVTGAQGYRLVTSPGFGGTTRPLRIDYANLGSVLRTTRPSDVASPKTEHDLFPELSGANTTYDPPVISSVTLPDGQRKYRFYYNAYGELARVELPTGGAIEYDYGPGLTNSYASGAVNLGTAFGGGFDWHIYRRVTERRVYADGNVLEGKTTYGRPETIDSSPAVQTLGYVRVEQRDAAGTVLSSQKHYFYGRGAAASLKSSLSSSLAFSYPRWKEGREYQTEAYAADGTTLLRRENRTWAQPVAGQTWPLTQAETSDSARPNDPRVVETLTTLAATSQLSRRTYAYDRFGNVTDTYEYDFGPVGSGAVGLFLRRTHTDFKTAAAYVDAAAVPASGAGLRSLPEQQWVSSDMAGNTRVALTTYAYDQDSPENCPQIIQHDGSYHTGFNTRGNLTGVTQYRDAAAGTGAVTTTSRYDIAGNVVSTTDAVGNAGTDPAGHTTYFNYADSFSDLNNGRNAYAFPKSTTTAAPNPAAFTAGGVTYGAGTFGSTAGLTSLVVYDFNTGLVTAATDANGQTTSYDFTDPLDRLKAVTRPDGGTTSYDYGRSNNAGRVSDYVATTTSLDAGRSVVSYQYFDGLGRPDRSLLNEGGSTTPYLTSDTQYDAAGRVWKVSNPYRSTGSDQAIPTPGTWTTTEYDALGRVKKVTTPDGAAVTTAYDGLQVTVTDQMGRKRSSVSDGLGRLTQVTEDPTAGGLNYQTAYTYDVLGNLLTVTQGVQTRTFVYDSLSRLTSAKNPESGTVTYTYDANSNLRTKTDARSIQTTYTYDRLNRNIITAYSGGGTTTPAAYHHYDNAAGGANGRGRLWYHSAGTSATGFNGYDAVGRVLEQHQNFLTGSTWSPDYSVKLEYNLAGDVTKQTYPSGHTVTYNYDAAGRLGDNGTQSAFTGNLGDGAARTYASQVTYSVLGGVEQERFGTQTPLYHKRHYNRRGQLFDIRLSTASWAANQWDFNRGAIVNYYSGNYAWEANPETLAGADNNGNLRRSTVYVPLDPAGTYTKTIADAHYSAQQTYSYDALNRLESVTEAHNNTQTNIAEAPFTQAYKYDRWSNRTIDAGLTSTAFNKPFDLNPEGDQQEVAEPSNRLYAAGDNNRLPGEKFMRYDAAGNLVFDSYTGKGARTYDAENRMTGAVYSQYGDWVYYTYDADGRRVRRKGADGEWWQVYGAGGELVAEYRAGAAAYLPSKEYGYRGGELLVTMSSGDELRLRRFVYNLYYGALQRDPTAQELEEKTNQLAAAGAQGQAQLLQKAKEVARSLFLQTNYETSPSRSDVQYVHDLYYTYLQRAPDDAGLNGWTAAAAGGGTNRSNVCDGFQESAEFAAVVSTLYGAAGSDDARTDAFVNKFYLAAGGTFASPSQLQEKRDQLDVAAAQGPDAVKAAAESMGRQMFDSQVSNLSIPAQQFVTNLYEGFLQRGPDAQGLAHWTAAAGTTVQSRQYVLDAFAACDPFKELAGTLYRETFWLVSDHLGTPRMIANRTGSLAAIKRHDYLPFGEELFASAGGRATTQGYSGGDNVRQKFTGYERDDETKLDYAQARYYASAQGRFTGPDEFVNDTTPVSPQKWNLYAYVNNNPLNAIDPTGMRSDFIDQEGNRTRIDDGRDQVIYAHSRVVQELTNYYSANRLLYFWHLGQLEQSPSNLHMTTGDFDKLAGVIYAEASNQATPGEAAAIHGVLRNRAGDEGNTVLDQAMDTSQVFGAREAERNKIFDKHVSVSKRQSVYLGIAISVVLGVDLSNGAYFWHGVDFKKPTPGSHAHERFYLVGFKFTSNSHDIWGLGDHTSGDVKVPYVYESTAAHGKTTFMRLTGTWKQAKGATTWRGK